MRSALQRAIRTCIMRGGTSKGIFLRASDLPPPGPHRDAIILRIFGSPDPRQIDGLGGADTLTSKLAIIGPPTREDADVDYTFGQVSFAQPFVDYGGNCGNISAAVGPYVIDERLVPAPDTTEHSRLVRIHNTNTGAILGATVPLLGGWSRVEGETHIAGVPGTGASIELDFSATQGSVTGRLLPTGRRQEELVIPADDTEQELRVQATLLDAGQPTVFVQAAALGLPHRSLASVDVATPTAAQMALELEMDSALLRRVERLRGVAAVKMGMVREWQEAEKVSPYSPFVSIVSVPPRGAAWDISAVVVFMQRGHKAYPVTGSVATTAASLLPGTVANDVCHLGSAKTESVEAVVRIGHPGGVMSIDAEMALGDKPTLLRCAITRTARRLMDGVAYIPNSL